MFHASTCVILSDVGETVGYRQTNDRGSGLPFGNNLNNLKERGTVQPPGCCNPFQELG